MSTASTAIIHFVGLVVFMTQPPSIMLKTSGAKTTKVRPAVLSPARAIAVLPEVRRPDPDMAQTERTTRDVSGPSLAEQAALVETHTAFIAFRESDYINSPGWTRRHLWTETDAQGNVIAQWKYIELFHDRITFQTGIVNAQPISLQGVPLPHITDQVGGANHTLLAGYQSPYSSAAAVIDLPAGTLTPCLSLATGVNKRTDTEVSVANNGQLTISNGTKSLTLKGDARVFAGNVPLAYAQHTSMNDFPGHYLVYCAMTNGTQCNPPYARPNEQLAGGPPDCGMNTMVTIPEDSRIVVPDPGPFHLMNIECSNTQWP